MKRISLVLLVFCFLGLEAQAQAFVHASGRYIVDGDGNPALQRGMGLGGWLVPEGYMLQDPGFGSPTSIWEQIVDVVGEAGAEAFYAAYHANYVTREDIHELAEWGFDHVRMPFHYNMFSPYRGVWNEWGFEVTDSLIAWCSEVGMHVVLDMHCAPGGQNGGNISDSDGTARFWLADSNRAHAIEIWDAIAQRYVDEEWIGGYDLLNEPVLPNGVTAQDLRSYYVTLRNVIRASDNNHIIFIEGNWYATDFAGLTPPFDVNMSYSFHKYWSTNDQASIQSYINMRGQTNVPLWMSESGENSNTWFYDAINLFETHDIGWCWWTTKKVSTITSPYSVQRPAGYDQLLNYWGGSGPKPNAMAAQTILMALADNLRTENCRFLPGVVASWFSPTFGTSNTPYKDLNIPGNILVADYDIGAQGVASYDNVYQTVHWDDYTAWNSGYQYRNDGVDIEQTASGVPTVGWTEAGEWMLYTIHAPQGGIYSLDMEFASPSTSGRVDLYLDGELLTHIMDTPITGGWQTFEALHIEDLNIPSGTHELKLQIVVAGFNLKSMLFNLDSADTEPGLPRDFRLGQNYPNPFNGDTTIPIQLLASVSPVLEVVDILGRVVYTLSINDGIGPQNVEWNGETDSGQRIPSGVYAYRLTDGQQQQVKKMVYIQ